MEKIERAVVTVALRGDCTGRTSLCSCQSSGGGPRWGRKGRLGMTVAGGKPWGDQAAS